MKANELKGRELAKDIVLFLKANSSKQCDQFGYGYPYREIGVDAVVEMLGKYFDIEFEKEDLEKLGVDEDEYRQTISDLKEYKKTQKEIEEEYADYVEKQKKSAIENLTAHYIRIGLNPSAAKRMAEEEAEDQISRVIWSTYTPEDNDDNL